MFDLFVDPERPRQTTQTLYEQFRDAIATGRLHAGDRLPTSRELAAELGVSRTTVVGVYGRLVAEGVLDARVGDGTFVADLGAAPPVARRSTGPSRTSSRQPASAPKVEIDLRTGRCDPLLFPLADWRRATLDALRMPPPGYEDPAGLPALRAALATWATRSRGVKATADRVIVTAGAQQAFHLLARTIAARGQTVAVEDPGYPPVRRAFEANGLRVAAVPVDAEGIVVEAIPRRARVIYVTPSHQSPTGVTMSIARRRELLRVAERNDALIIEDDYDTEYRYVDRPLEPLHRLDAGERVIYVGSFSKTLTPSLRLGFVVAPPALVTSLTEERRLLDLQPPHLTQAALCNFLRSGDFERHLRRLRRIMRVRHRIVTDAVASLHEERLIPAPHVTNAGLHVMIGLPRGRSSVRAAERLARRGVAVEPIDGWRHGSGAPGLLIGFGLAGPEELGRAFDHLRAELRERERGDRRS